MALYGFQELIQSFQRLNHLSVAEWVQKDFLTGLYDLYFLPFAKSSLNAPDQMSVGELMQFFHFYFFGNPEGLAFNGTQQDLGTSLVQPIARAIQEILDRHWIILWWRRARFNSSLRKPK